MTVDVFLVWHEGAGVMVCDVAGTLLGAIAICTAATERMYYAEGDGQISYGIREVEMRETLSAEVIDGLVIEAEHGDPPCPYAEPWYIVKRTIEVTDAR